MNKYGENTKWKMQNEIGRRENLEEETQKMKMKRKRNGKPTCENENVSHGKEREGQ